MRHPAPVYLREIQARGYEGGLTILKVWLSAQYPQPEAQETRHFETAPGYQARADWTHIRSG